MQNVDCKNYLPRFLKLDCCSFYLIGVYVTSSLKIEDKWSILDMYFFEKLILNLEYPLSYFQCNMDFITRTAHFHNTL